jgi:hypothetical protein
VFAGVLCFRDVIDARRLDAQSEAAAADKLGKEGKFQCRQNGVRLRWLNQWLSQR